MNFASTAVGEVIQGGSRRGAAMFMLADWHPDVEAFVEAKLESGKIENANISVAVSDDFMQAVRGNEDWRLRFPDTTHSAYNTEWDGDIREWEAKGYPVKTYGIVNARDLWARLASSAWRSGEPGIVFLDRYNALSTANGQEKIISVNPCGEQGLGAYSVCNLGSMNLDAYAGTHGAFDWKRFKVDVRTAIRFLDNVIDKTYYHLPETKIQQMKLRRIGLGVMGLADALIKLNMRYGHSDAVEFTEKVFRTMKDAAIVESRQLAIERGPAGGWRDSMWDRPYLKEFADRRLPSAVSPGPNAVSPGPLRNLFLLTQAPTGTTAALAGVNSGIEPYFAFEYTRSDRTGSHRIVADIVEWAKGVGHESALVTSNDVTGKEHLLMQGAAQKYIDSSVSKTVNLPNDATEQQVQEVYDLAWDLGCKGLAVYRDGSRDKQVLYREDPNKRIAELEAKLEALQGHATGFLGVHPNANGFDKPLLPLILFANTPAGSCPSCTGTVVMQEGCSKCQSCSWSAC